MPEKRQPTAKRSTRRTKTGAKAKAGAPGSRLRVRQVRSGIGHPQRYRRTLEALGLRKHQAEVVVLDNPSIRGMLRRVHNLVCVTPEGA